MRSTLDILGFALYLAAWFVAAWFVVQAIS